MGTAAPAASADTGDMLALEVKATYLYKLPPFIQWPNDAFATPASPFALCVVGPDPFGDVLDNAVAGQRLFGRPVTVIRLAQIAHDSPCQLVYIAPGAQPVADILAAVSGAPMLTVTDSVQSDPRGIVNFIVRDNHIRFEIDLGAARRNRLDISSKLLGVAASVTSK